MNCFLGNLPYLRSNCLRYYYFSPLRFLPFSSTFKASVSPILFPPNGHENILMNTSNILWQLIPQQRPGSASSWRYAWGKCWGKCLREISSRPEKRAKPVLIQVILLNTPDTSIRLYPRCHTSEHCQCGKLITRLRVCRRLIACSQLCILPCSIVWLLQWVTCVCIITLCKDCFVHFNVK